MRTTRTAFPVFIILAAIAGIPAAAGAQGDDTTYTKPAQQEFTRISGLILRTAEKVPEDLYSFKPAPEVRSMGALLGHVADDHFFLCRVAAGESPKYEPFYEKKTSKAEIVAALKESNAFCAGVFAKMNDTSGKVPATAFGGTMPRLSWLSTNTGHSQEHYGNLVTYMRLKNIVPPSSEKKPGASQ